MSTASLVIQGPQDQTVRQETLDSKDLLVSLEPQGLKGLQGRQETLGRLVSRERLVSPGLKAHKVSEVPLARQAHRAPKAHWDPKARKENLD